MADFVEKAYFAGLGALTMTKEKAKKWVDELVEKGKIKAEEGPTLLKEVVTKAEETKMALEERIQKGIENAFSKLNVASKSDIQALEKKLDAILKELQKKS